jgi:hypothetical protein
MGDSRQGDGDWVELLELLELPLELVFELAGHAIVHVGGEILAGLGELLVGLLIF